MRGSIVRWGLCVVLGAGLAGMVGSGHAQEPGPDPRWGVLAEITEGDYRIAGNALTARWTIPGRELQLAEWSFWGGYIATYRIEGDRIRVVPPREWPMDEAVLTVDAEGIVRFPDGSPHLSAKGDGTYHMRMLTPRKATEFDILHADDGVRKKVATLVSFIGEAKPRGSQVVLPPNLDPIWGPLADLVERDSLWHGATAMTSRWTTPGEELVWTQWAQLGTRSLDYVFKREADGLRLTADSMPPRLLKVAPDGVLEDESGAPFLWRRPTGGYGVRFILEDGRESQLTIVPDSPAIGNRVARLVANGHVRAANPRLHLVTSQMAAVPDTAPEGIAAETDRPALPAATLSAGSAIEAYVGTTLQSFRDGKVVSVATSRWLIPGKQFERRGTDITGDFTGVFAIDGDTITGQDLTTGVQFSGRLTDHGVYEVEFDSEGKRYKQELLPAPGGGFTSVVYEQVKRLLRSPVWKEISRSSRTPLSEAQALALTAELHEKRKARWGALANLPGEAWYCHQYEPDHWVVRSVGRNYGRITNRSLPTGRITTAKWTKDPYLALEVTNRLGDGREWVDRITLQHDGMLAMSSSGVTHFASSNGSLRNDGSVHFDMGSYVSYDTRYHVSQSYATDPMTGRVQARMHGDALTIPCTFEAFDEQKLPEWEQYLASARQSVADSIRADYAYIQETARREEEQRQMAANMQAQAFGALLGAVAQAVAPAGSSYTPAMAAVPDLMNANPLQVLQGMAAQAQAEAEVSRQSLERTIAYAQQQGELQRQQREQDEQAARDQANRNAAQVAADAERQRQQDAQRLAEQQQQREAEALAERQRQAEAQRLAEQRRREEEARRPVAFQEGVTLCTKLREKQWRCEGPLQNTQGNIEEYPTAIHDACGANGARDLGMVGGFRAFGCGFGIHPTDRDYPGNRDIPARYGLYVPSRAVFYCPITTDAYCRGG